MNGVENQHSSTDSKIGGVPGIESNASHVSVVIESKIGKATWFVRSSIVRRNKENLRLIGPRPQIISFRQPTSKTMENRDLRPPFTTEESNRGFLAIMRSYPTPMKSRQAKVGGQRRNNMERCVGLRVHEAKLLPRTLQKMFSRHDVLMMTTHHQ